MPSFYWFTKYCRKIEHSFAIKPIISGFKKEDHESDSAKILNALGLEINQHNLDLISPWRFELAASPHIAANDEIIPELLQSNCNPKNIFNVVGTFLDDPSKVKEQVYKTQVILNQLKTSKSSSELA